MASVDRKLPAQETHLMKRKQDEAEKRARKLERRTGSTTKSTQTLKRNNGPKPGP